ncbi:MAG TPA: hypothetical protein VMY16_04725, partial [Ilumatobacteraceae bacterium]|nr:hypothetical protein [Ilumatobacteraceae bacterium]
DPTAPAVTVEMGLAHFWHGNPHLWQIATASGTLQQWAPDGTSLFPPVPVGADQIRGGVAPGGELALVVDEEGTGTVVDVAAGSTLGTLSRRLDLTDPVVFADGRAVVRELDGQIALWSLRDRRRIGAIGRTDTESGTRMAPSATGLWYLTEDEFVHVDLRPASWLLAACEQAGRSLTDAEWDEYVARGDPTDACAPESN